MDFYRACFLLIFCVLTAILGKDENPIINIGYVSPEVDDDTINWDALNDQVKGYKIVMKPLVLPQDDCFNTVNTVCQAASEEGGLAAILGPQNIDIFSTLQSIGNHLGIPVINTEWTPRDINQITSFNMYPEAAMLSQAYAAIVESLDWSTFAVVYENEESLIRLQDVIKLQQHQHDVNKNGMLIKKLDPTGDSRHVFKEIRKTPIYSIVLDCSTDKILDVLLQAKDVRVLDELNSNIFLTSLDAHTLDYSILNARSNFTTVRLFDPSTPIMEAQLTKYYPNVRPDELTVKKAIMHDAILLLGESFSATIKSKGEIVYEPLFCNATEKYDDKYGLVSTLQEATVSGITGSEINLRNLQRDTFQLDVIELYRKDKPIGHWYSSDVTTVVLTRNATEREEELRRRLQNHNFIVTSRIGGPYLFLNKDPDATGNSRYTGYSIDLIDEIAKILNITYKFQITEGNLYPNLQKDLIERRADLAICDFTITPQRREVIDFSMPFMTLGIGILHRKETEQDDSSIYGFLGPFSKVVWLYICLLYLLMSLILVVIARLATKDWENPHPCDENPAELENIWTFKNCLWLTLGSITTQGCDILPKGGCTRIATASWWFFSLIIASSYTANLAAFLTMSKKGDSIKSVDDLAAQSKVKYGCLANGATASFFQYSNNSLYQRMWNTMINEKPSVFEDSNLKGVERVKSTKNALYAFFMESTGIEYEMETDCELRRIGDLLDSKSYGIGMPLNAEYRHSINAAVLKLQETGKLIELKEKWWKKERENETCMHVVEETSEALALLNVGGVFIVLAAGVGLAYIIAILEFFWNVRNISVEEHISYWEALKIELKFACNISITRKRVKPLISESSSAKSEDQDTKSSRAVLTGAGSFLNINASILNRIASEDYKRSDSKRSS